MVIDRSIQFAPLYPILYRILQPVFPSCLWCGNASKPTIALTFDDGPHPRYTPPLLDVLNQHQIVASFFCLGYAVDQHPSITREIYDRGHWLGLHGYTHRPFPTLSPFLLKQNLEHNQQAIARACQISPQAVRHVRPPYGLVTPHTLKLLHQWHYQPVMWSVVPEDWVNPGVATVIDRVLQQVEPGSVIVLHDGAHGGQAVSEISNQLIPALLTKGYQFVTVDELGRQSKM